MAAVQAELRCRDGQTEKLHVQVEKNLKSLISGIHELNVNVSRVLSELVEREKVHGVCAEGEEDESDEDESDEDDEPPKAEEQPPPKRYKT